MKKIFFIVWFLTLFLFACGGSSGDNDPTTTDGGEVLKTYSGKLEKGAFQQGAEIIAYGWNTTDGFTGESFSTTTTDDLGNYSLSSTKIKDILYVKAEGYFYNENTNAMSASTLKLYGMVDSTKVPWNINVLTHIIKDRVIVLLEAGSDYDTSVSQAVGELFSALNWSIIDPGTQSVVNNANLLFFSAAICKNRTEAEVSDILTTIATDLSDGSVDISVLDDSFSSVDCTEVIANMTAKYGSCPDIESVKTQVLDYRNIEDSTIRQITMIPISASSFYLYKNSSLYGFVSNQIQSLNISYTQKYLGETTTQNCIVNDFFSVVNEGVKTLYFQITFPYDSSVKMYSQTNGVITEVTEFPEKPVAESILFDDTYYTLQIINGNTTQVLSKNTGTTLARNAEWVTGYYESEAFTHNSVDKGAGIFTVWSSGIVTWLSRDTVSDFIQFNFQGVMW